MLSCQVWKRSKISMVFILPEINTDLFWNTDKDHWFDMSIRELTRAMVAPNLATLTPILGFL